MPPHKLFRCHFEHMSIVDIFFVYKLDWWKQKVIFVRTIVRFWLIFELVFLAKWFERSKSFQLSVRETFIVVIQKFALHSECVHHLIFGRSLFFAMFIVLKSHSVLGLVTDVHNNLCSFKICLIDDLFFYRQGISLKKSPQIH